MLTHEPGRQRIHAPESERLGDQPEPDVLPLSRRWLLSDEPSIPFGLDRVPAGCIRAASMESSTACAGRRRRVVGAQGARRCPVAGPDHWNGGRYDVLGGATVSGISRRLRTRWPVKTLAKR